MNLNEQTNRIKQMMGILTEASKKDILVNKLGFSEENATELERLCGPFSVWLGNKYIQFIFNILRQFSSELTDDELKNVTLKKINTNSGFDITNKISEFTSIMDYIRIGLNGDNSSIKNLNFKQIYAKSEQWHESLEIKGGEINYKETHPIIIDFKDGYYWTNLQTNNSPEECERMGHCGKTAYGNTIYSLRRNIQLPGGKHTINKSLLTASIDNVGTLYQLKGPKNSKPSEEYFKYIIPLFFIKNPENGENLIQGFGREYGHERDFKIADLSKEEILKLIQKRPDLFDDEDIIIEIANTNPDVLPDIYQKNPELFNPNETDIIDKKGEKFPELITQIYQDYPEWFETVKLKYALFKIGLIKEDPINWIVEVKLDPDDVEDYVDGGWTVGKRKTKYGGTRDYSLFEAILEGDTWDLYQSYDVDWKSSLEYYTDEENKKKIYNILTKMNPDTEFDSDMDLDELIEEYDDDNNIRGAIHNATESCEADSYVSYLEKELKSTLEEYGHVLSLGDEGVTIRVDLKVLYNNLYNEDYFWEYMDNCNYDSSCVFTELVKGGDVDKPKFYVDDRWYPDVDTDDFNHILRDNLGEYL